MHPPWASAIARTARRDRSYVLLPPYYRPFRSAHRRCCLDMPGGGGGARHSLVGVDFKDWNAGDSRLINAIHAS